MNVYSLQLHKLNFLMHSYFYKLVCMFSEDSDQPAYLRSLSSLQHCFFVQIAQIYSGCGMRRLIQFLCYFEINVYLQKTVFSFPVVYCIFMKQYVFQYIQSSIINHSLLKADGHYYYTLTCWARKKNEEIFLFFFSGKWDLTFQILFYGKNKKNLINSSSAETAHNVVNDNSQMSVRKTKYAPK